MLKSHFRFAGIFRPEDANAKAMRLCIGQEGHLRLYWLVDPEDGILADVKFQAFGPIGLLNGAEIACELLLRKHYAQASRITADLLERDFPKEAKPFINQILFCIDEAVQQCHDLPGAPNDYDVTPIAWETEGPPAYLEDWDTFPQEKKLHLIEMVIDKEIRPYIELDAGGVTLVKLEPNGALHIAYEGACTTCHSATGSTLSAIQQILRARLHPSLTVIPQLS